MIVPSAGIFVPKVSLHDPGSVVAYLNQPVVEEPLGLMVELRVAVVNSTAVAGLVVTVGGIVQARVVIDLEAESVVPWLLTALIIYV